MLAFVQVGDSCGCVLEGHPEREALLLLTYSICKYIQILDQTLMTAAAAPH